jgi:hypothetical protein
MDMDMDTEQLEDLVRGHGLWEHREAILAASRPAIYMYLGAAGQGETGRSRIGGIPDLPASLPWPRDPLGRHLRFILQVAFAHLPEYPGSPLPVRGMLYLFADDMEHRAEQVVVYTGSEPLWPRHADPGAEFVTDWYDGLVPHRLEFQLAADVPRWATSDFHALCEALGPDGEDRLGDLASELSEDSVGRLLGHVAGIGVDPREDAYVAREVNPAWVYDYAKRAALDMSRAASWHNLLEVDSSRAVNLAFSDSGYLQVLVHEDDLRRQDFSRVYVNVESS